MKTWRFAAVMAIALSGTFALTSTAGASGRNHHWGHHHGVYVCNGSSGGVIPAGFYGSVLVTGVCSTPAGNVFIANDLTVAPGALLDAVTPGDPTTGTPAVPATVLIGGNVFVQKGGVLLLGCSPNISCAPPTAGISFDQIRGSLFSFGAQGVVLHSVSVGGSVSINGGGGGAAAQTCNAQMPGAPVDTTLTPWSEDPALDYTPVYTDFEDVSIGGNLRVAGLTSCWLGSLRDIVGGSALFANNTLGDPDGSEIVNNLIGHNLSCFGNSPAPQFGDSGGASDLVNGWGQGQCSFSVVVQNPPAEAIAGNMETGVGVSENLVVSTHSLRRYYGAHTSTNVATLPGYPVTTSSGDSIFADLNSFALTGNGLTGTATYTGGAPGQAPGEAVLGTTYPNGVEQFTAYDTCTSCSFDRQTGPTSVRAYGTTTPKGFTSGIFLITSSGALLATSSSPVPGLATLVGFGYFWGSGGTLHLQERLGFA